MARVALRDLLDSDGIEGIGLADLSIERVSQVASETNDDRVTPIRAEANDPSSLAETMRGWDVVINSTWYELNLKVMGAAIKAGIHYLDLGGLYHMTLKQLALDSQARDAGVTCLVGLGSAPGVTNLMAAHGASRMSKVSRVSIRTGGGSPRPASSIFRPPYSFRTILDEACLPAAVFKDGAIQMVPGLSVKEEFVLPDPVGKVEGYMTLHSELATLPDSIGKGIRYLDFIVAFAPEFTRSLELLVGLGLAGRDPVPTSSGEVVPYDLLTRLVDDLPRTTGPAIDYGVRRVRLEGEVDGRTVALTYDCVSGPHQKWQIGGRALGTGVPASLGAQWLAGGRVKEKGVHPPERCIDPEPFLRELSSMGRGVATFVDDGNERKIL